MKTDLNSLKKELNRLTDINYLKKEINRIAGEVKKFNVHQHLTPQANTRLEHLEERFHEALATLKHLQAQVDTSLDKFVALVRQRTTTMRAARTSKSKASGKVRSVKKTARKAVRKASKKK